MDTKVINIENEEKGLIQKKTTKSKKDTKDYTKTADDLLRRQGQHCHCGIRWFTKEASGHPHDFCADLLAMQLIRVYP